MWLQVRVERRNYIPSSAKFWRRARADGLKLTNPLYDSQPLFSSPNCENFPEEKQ
jgi:hypothetical protein